MTRILALDVGTTHSGLADFDIDKQELLSCGKPPNEVALAAVRNLDYDELVLEDFTAGSFFGYDSIETVKWIGRFWQTALDRGKPVSFVKRDDVKKHLLGRCRFKKGVDSSADTLIRRAIIDRLDPAFAATNPTPRDYTNYRFKLQAQLTKDAYAALAVAFTFGDKRNGIKGRSLPRTTRKESRRSKTA